MFIVSQPIRYEMKLQKDDVQTAARISDDLIQKNDQALSSSRNLQLSLVSLKKLFLPQTNTSHLIPSVQKPNY